MGMCRVPGVSVCVYVDVCVSVGKRPHLLCFVSLWPCFFWCRPFELTSFFQNANSTLEANADDCMVVHLMKFVGKHSPVMAWGRSVKDRILRIEEVFWKCWNFSFVRLVFFAVALQWKTSTVTGWPGACIQFDIELRSLVVYQFYLIQNWDT